MSESERMSRVSSDISQQIKSCRISFKMEKNAIGIKLEILQSNFGHNNNHYEQKKF